MENNCIECLCNQVKRLYNIINNLPSNTTTVNVNSTTTLPSGSDAVVTNVGTDTNVELDFEIPKGADGTSPTIGTNGNWFVGTTDTGIHAQGTPGANGLAATTTVGTTTTLAAGLPATVTNVGTTSAAIFNFGIPQGIPGTTGSSNLVHASLYGALLNDVDQPSTVASGARIPWKTLNNNGSGLITVPVGNAYFQFTKTGRYLCTFSLRCATKTSGENTVVSWGLYAQSIKKAMVTSASAFVVPNMTNISGVGIFDVTDLNEQYNLINNSKISIQVQGATSAQVFTNAFKDFNGVNIVDGMSCTFIRIGEPVGL